MFEEDYELIKKDPNKAFEKYYYKVYSQLKYVCGKYKIPTEPLMAIMYEKFLRACKEYDPYRNSSFIPFGKYITTIMNCHIRGYIAWQKRKYLQDCPSIEELNYVRDNKNELNNIINKVFLYEIYNLCNDLQKKIIDLTLLGYYQTEIAKELNVTQSCISQNFKKIKRNFDRSYNKFPKKRY